MLTEFSARTRANNIKTFKTEPLDVLVIGGGIVGAGLIRDLALNGGIKAGLIEQGDFANGNSSATSQLVHGGFRYLLKRDIDLVKKSRKEREILQRHCAESCQTDANSTAELQRRSVPVDKHTTRCALLQSSL